MRARRIGIPNHGVELKLVPNGGKLEARLKSPSITPGYWRQPELTKTAFDEEGYYKIGDAMRFADESDPERGFVFDGRVAEDFKLATGTWVSVGPLKAQIHRPLRALCDRRRRRRPGPRRRRARSSCPISQPAANSLDSTARPAKARCSRIRRCGRSSPPCSPLSTRPPAAAPGRFARIILMDDPPSLDSGELTDKGSINQRAVLALRAAMVDELYAETPSSRTISSNGRADP